MKKNMPFYWFLMVFLTFKASFSASGGSLHAQDFIRSTEALDILFTIREIKIDRSDRSSLIAREKGLQEAQEHAFNSLLRKIVSNEDLDRVPQISFREKVSMIRGIEYVSERRSGKRYLATINIGFEPVKLASFLSENGIPHVLGAGTGVLIVHTHSHNGLDYMWEETNPALAAWNNVDSLNRLRSYKSLEDSLSIRATIGAETVKGALLSDKEGGAAFFQKLAKENGMDEAVLMHTNYNEFTQTVDFMYKLTATGLSGQGTIQKDIAFTLRDNSESNAVNKLSFALDQILAEVDDSWRSRLLINSSVVGEISLIIPTNSLSDLATVQRAIDSLSLVQEWKVLEIGIPVSKAFLKYRGREDQLTLALKLAGLKIEAYGEEWLLKPLNQ
ncbi:hypothetical protein QGN29_11510 [Temperatibacter marinus]|uniref:DUF2066 domain-containing protein n=1 Tax=Temperatibacter marinus TaxID=1456591 RepID=A0AA52EBA4_9PROT|nr:hypothetical protein [Temperatibacter marinus]WND02177.1 hypothetical protein QGN29_11510 [Temperatibacter marinus]